MVKRNFTNRGPKIRITVKYNNIFKVPTDKGRKKVLKSCQYRVVYPAKVS